MPAVSIVIPVYNIGKYLEKCLDSVVAQTFPDIEIIVVNDGSTDNSPDKSNEGLAYARKSGIEAARGTYIYHLDGDDYLEFDAIELLYRKAKEEDADMVVFPFSLDYIESGKSECSIEIADEHFTNTEFFSAIAFSKAHWGVWSYLHKRSLYESSITNSRFNEKKARDILLYPSLVNDFLKDKPEYGSLQKALGAIRIQANNTLLSKRWFKDARTLSRESHAILKQYPDLKRIPQIKAFHKLFTLYARSGLLGRLYAQYYICKKKIK